MPNINENGSHYKLWAGISMYVCVCKGITERDIHEAASRGARTLKDLRCDLGVASACGTCASFAHEVLCEARGETALPVRLQAA